MKRIIIIGGGVAGLGAAYAVRRASDSGIPVEFVLVEKDDRLGGKLLTEFVDSPEAGGRFVIDGGSDSFLTEKPAVHRIAQALDILDRETGTCDENKKTFIVKDGRLVELPDGIMMFAPTKVWPMATTKLYSWPAKIRMAFDLLIPKRKPPYGERLDESLESFVVRRMGRECLDRLAEPLVGGVNGSDPSTMSLAATYPMLLDMEQQHGSLIRGFLAQRQKVEAMKKKYPPKPGQPRRTFFTSFKDGLQSLTDAMASAAGVDHLRSGVAATEIARMDDGWVVRLANGESLRGDAVIVASEPWAAGELLATVDPRTADLIGQIPCSSSATIAVAFRESEFPADTHWHGILSPGIERIPVTGISLVSSKWPERAPEGFVLLRGFVGGPRDQEILERTDAELVEIALKQFRSLLGLAEGASPLFWRVYRWEKGMPQYTIGHLDRVEEIESRTHAIAGLALAGSGYRGVGVPNCLESGEQAVYKVLADLGLQFQERVEAKRVY